MRFVIDTLALALALALAGPTAARGAVLTLVPDDPHPVAGSVLGIEVEIADLQVGCFSFSVDYDPAVLVYLGAEEGSLFANAPEPTFFSDDVDAQGRPQPNDCILGFGTSVTGPGTIALLRFDVLDDVATTVSVRDAVLRDVDRIPLPDVADVGVEIGATTTDAPVASWNADLSAYPNPSSGRLSFVLAGRAVAQPGRLTIFDVAGRLVRDLQWPAGAQSCNWDGRDVAGRPVANGIYLARMQSGDRRAQTRIVRVK